MAATAPAFQVAMSRMGAATMIARNAWRAVTMIRSAASISYRFVNI